MISVSGVKDMASRLARAKLARAAAALNAKADVGDLPALILMTDENRLRDPALVARGLPKGCAIILRHTDALARARIAHALARIAHERALILLIAGDPGLAVKIGAHGLHLPETRTREAAHWKALRPSWLVTAAAHSARAVGVAAMCGADATLLAPAFPTLSHAERTPIGTARFRLIAARATLPLYALGGVNAETVRRLEGAHLAGIGAIDGLIPDQSE
jgi:thiamine-phosphate pyrophosphorylase